MFFFVVDDGGSVGIGSGTITSNSAATGIPGLLLFLSMPMSAPPPPAAAEFETVSLSHLSLVRCRTIESSAIAAAAAVVVVELFVGLWFFFRNGGGGMFGVPMIESLFTDSVGDGVCAGEMFGICNFVHGGKLLGSK